MLGEANGSKVVAVAEEEAGDGGETIVLGCAGVNGWLVLGVRLGEEGSRF